MNYAGIKYCDIANGLGCRTVLFVSGCRNHCKGCFQPQTWEFDYGEPFDEQIQNEILDSLKPSYVQGITLLGGDPFEEENQEALVPFMRRVKERYPNKDVWAYTGYLYEELLENGRKHTEYTDEKTTLHSLSNGFDITENACQNALTYLCKIQVFFIVALIKT